MASPAWRPRERLCVTGLLSLINGGCSTLEAPPRSRHSIGGLFHLLRSLAGSQPVLISSTAPAWIADNPASLLPRRLDEETLVPVRTGRDPCLAAAKRGLVDNWASELPNSSLPLVGELRHSISSDIETKVGYITSAAMAFEQF